MSPIPPLPPPTPILPDAQVLNHPKRPWSPPTVILSENPRQGTMKTYPDFEEAHNNTSTKFGS